MKRKLILLWALLAGLIAACGGAAESSDSTTATTTTPAPEPADIVGVATEAGSFSTLLTAVEAAGLVETLQGEGPFTVFAPTDEAFAALPEGTLDSLLADTEALSQVLHYHVVPGEVMASAVVELDSAPTAQGEDIAITIEGDSVKVNQAEVIATDVVASNGVIHVIDQVILPPSMSMETAEMGDIVEIAEAAGEFGTLLTAVEAAGLVETLQGDGPFTVFAPTDEAFAALPEGTLDALLADADALTQVLLLPRGARGRDCRAGGRARFGADRARRIGVDTHRGRKGVHQRRPGDRHRCPCVQWRDPRHRPGNRPRVNI